MRWLAGGGVPCAGRGQALGPGPWFLPPRGRRGLRGQGRPAGPSPQRCAAALRPEGRPRTLRGTPPGSERRRQPPPWSCLPAQAAWPSSISASASAGVFQPRVLRGRSLSSSATAARCSRAVHGQVGALGEVLAQQPVGVLVGAPLPRRVRVAEVDLACPRRPRSARAAAISLPWSQVSDRRSASGSVCDLRRSAPSRHRRPRMPVGQVHQHREPGGALHQRADRGLACPRR